MGAPSLIDAQAEAILDRMNALTEYARSHVYGGLVSDGGTTQATGANTAPNLDLDVSALFGVVDGAPVNVAAAADVDATAGDSVVWGATSGKSIKCAVVVEPDGTFEIVPGAVADTGAEEGPTDAQIDAAAPNGWSVVAHVTFTRTGDTAITVGTPDYSGRASVDFDRALAVSETEFRAVS